MVKKIVTILKLFLLSALAYSQDSLWQKLRVDDNLVLFFPNEFSISDTLTYQYGQTEKSKEFVASGSFSTLGITVTPAETGTDNKTGRKLNTLHDISQALCDEGSTKGWSCLVSDTIIDNIPGKKNELYAPGNRFDPRLFRYVFLVSGKAYIFHIHPLNGNNAGAIDESKRLLRGIHFISGMEKKEIEPGKVSASKKMNYPLGYLSIPIVLIVGSIIYIKKTRVKKRQRMDK